MADLVYTAQALLNLESLSDFLQEIESRAVQDAADKGLYANPNLSYLRTVNLGCCRHLWSMSTILTARRQLSWPVEAGNEFDCLCA